MISWAFKMVMYAVAATTVIVIVMDIGGQNRAFRDGGDHRAAVLRDGRDGAEDGERSQRTVRTTPEKADAEADSARKVRIPAKSNGQFYVDAQVNGKTILFLVDTGASDVVLTRDDARRLGIVPSDRDYTRRYQTANGTIRAAPVTLRKIKIRRLTLYNIEATVNESPMAISLLGMGFLNELRGYEVKNDTLTMLW